MSSLVVKLVVGLKTIEIRCRPTSVRQRVHLYASKIPCAEDGANLLRERFALSEDLPIGVLVGTVEIVGCHPLVPVDCSASLLEVAEVNGYFGWELANPKRAIRLVRPIAKPQPVWFYPFNRENTGWRGPRNSSGQSREAGFK